MIELKINGEIASKSNSRRIVRRGNKFAVIKSQKALDYIDAALPQIALQMKNKRTLEKSIVMEVHVWYASRRPDLDVSLLMDVLQTAGIYKNDRQIVEQHLFKYLDKENPRILVRVWETDYEL